MEGGSDGGAFGEVAADGARKDRANGTEEVADEFGIKRADRSSDEASYYTRGGGVIKNLILRITNEKKIIYRRGKFKKKLVKKKG